MRAAMSISVSAGIDLSVVRTTMLDVAAACNVGLDLHVSQAGQLLDDLRDVQTGGGAADLHVMCIEQQIGSSLCEELGNALRGASDNRSGPILVIAPYNVLDDWYKRAIPLQSYDQATNESSWNTIVVRSLESFGSSPAADTAEQVAAISDQVAAAVGLYIVRFACRLVGATAYKLIAVDCDDTLWGGTCSEDPIGELTVSNTQHALHHRLLELRKVGVMLAIISRNELADVMRALERDFLKPLTQSDFVEVIANWEPKSDSISSLSMRFGVGLNDILVIDNDQLECLQINSTFPEVTCLRFDASDPSLIETFWGLDLPSVSSSIDRTRWEISEQNRRESRQAAKSYEEFLRELQIRIGVLPIRPVDYLRIGELTFRTNQFNATGKALSPAHIEREVASGKLDGAVLTLADRFGDAGVIGHILFTLKTDVVEVISFCVSCRALRRGVEFAALRFVAERAIANRRDSVSLPSIDTQHNIQYRAFLRLIEPAAEEHGAQLEHIVMPVAALLAVSFNADVEPPPLVEAKSKAFSSGLAGRRRIVEIGSSMSVLPLTTSAEGVLQSMAELTSMSTVEDEIYSLFSESLQSTQLARDADFFALGGSSFKALEMAIEIRRRFKVKLSLQDVFGDVASVRRITSLVEGYKKQVELGGESESGNV